MVEAIKFARTYQKSDFYVAALEKKFHTTMERKRRHAKSKAS
jgi:hypothetical protein